VLGVVLRGFCSLNVANDLRPGQVKKGRITLEEHNIIAKARAKKGARWVEIVALLPGRTECAIKNYWNAFSGKRRKIKRANSPATPVSTQAIEQSMADRVVQVQRTGVTGSHSFGRRSAAARQVNAATPAQLCMCAHAARSQLGCVAHSNSGIVEDGRSAECIPQRHNITKRCASGGKMNILL
jgi:hypothetical protein